MTIPGTWVSPQVIQHAVPGGGSTPCAGGTAPTVSGVTGPARCCNGTPGLVRIPPAMCWFYPPGATTGPPRLGCNAPTQGPHVGGSSFRRLLCTVRGGSP